VFLALFLKQQPIPEQLSRLRLKLFYEKTEIKKSETDKKIITIDGFHVNSRFRKAGSCFKMYASKLCAKFAINFSEILRLIFPEIWRLIFQESKGTSVEN
jgi:hypothetical protein